MPRTRRLIPVGEAALHIMCRGNNKQDVFKNDEDKLYYCSLLLKFIKEDNIDIFHYCLMNNHVHLIVWLGPESRISRFMKQLSLAYYSYCQKKYEYCGHLWQGRFKSNIIDSEAYLLQCGKYIELNPVRARYVSKPNEYRFSSYSHYATGKYDPIITNSGSYLGLAQIQEKRMLRYIQFVVDEDVINKNKFK